MKGLYSSVWAETLKMRKSKMFMLTLIVFSGIAITMGLMILVTRNPELAGNSAMVSAKASMFKDDWSSYFGLLTMIVLTLGTIGFGTIAGWIFGREYSDRVVQDLLALPVHRFTIVLSKFITFVAWSILLSLILFIIGVFTGLTVNIARVLLDSLHYFIIFMVNFLFLPCYCVLLQRCGKLRPWIMAPIAFTIGTLISNNNVCGYYPTSQLYFPGHSADFICGISGGRRCNSQT